jgi:hypothetical protein
LTAPHGADPIEDLYAGGHGDDHARKRELW